MLSGFYTLQYICTKGMKVEFLVAPAENFRFAEASLPYPEGQNLYPLRRFVFHHNRELAGASFAAALLHFIPSVILGCKLRDVQLPCNGIFTNGMRASCRNTTSSF